MNLELVRFAYLKDATLGWLKVGDLKLATLEEPWIKDPDGPGGQRREGSHPESCVQDGFYKLLPHTSEKYSNAYALVAEKLGVYRWPDDIPPEQKWGRSAILIHSGNTTKDTMGCILVGMRHSTNGSKPFVESSRDALQLLCQKLGRSGEHTLVICPTVGTSEA